jgi:hypothetical protein
LPGIARPIWVGGRLRQRLYRWFENRLTSDGRTPGDATLRPHGLRRIFLRPTVVVAAACKFKSLVPVAGGGFKYA